MVSESEAKQALYKARNECIKNNPDSRDACEQFMQQAESDLSQTFKQQQTDETRRQQLIQETTDKLREIGRIR